MFETRLPMNRPEIGLLAMFFITAAYMFTQAQDFIDPVARLPLAASATTMIGIGLIVVRAVLTSLNMWPGMSDELSEETELKADDHEIESEETSISDRDLLVIVALTGGYVVSGYAVGLLWVTPLFALAYSLLFDLGWRETAVVLAGCLVAAGIFIWLTNLNLTQGVVV